MMKVNVPGLKDRHKRTSRSDDIAPHLLYLGTSGVEVPVKQLADSQWGTPRCRYNLHMRLGGGLQCRPDAVGEKTCFSQELNLDLSAVEPITVSLC